MSSDEFILANLRASGFYRVNYDSIYWKSIIEQLMTSKDVRNT
jgi:hypothetical protein